MRARGWGLFASVILGPLAVIGPANAGDISQCDATLIATNESTVSDQSVRIAIDEMVTENTFNQAKSGLSNGVTFMLGDIPITNQTNWDQYQESRRDFLQQLRYNFGSNSYYNYVRSFLSPESGTAYANCINGLNLTLRLKIAQVSGGFVAIQLYFPTSTSDATKRKFTVTVWGAVLSKQDQSWFDDCCHVGPIDGKKFLLQHHPHESVAISVGIEKQGDEDSVIIPLLPRVQIEDWGPEQNVNGQSVYCPAPDGSNCQRRSSVFRDNNFELIAGSSNPNASFSGHIASSDAHVEVETKDEIRYLISVGADSCCSASFTAQTTAKEHQKSFTDVAQDPDWMAAQSLEPTNAIPGQTGRPGPTRPPYKH